MELTDSVQLTKVLLLVSLLLFCSATDISMRRIPNAVLLPALMTAIFLNSVGGGLIGLADSVGGLVIGILILMPMYLLRRMGAGDIKLLGVVGSILGAWGALVAGLATMIAGGILGIAYMAWLLAKPHLKAWMSYTTGFRSDVPANSMSDAPLPHAAREAEIPYAVAIAAGTFAAISYLGLVSEAINA